MQDNVLRKGINPRTRAQQLHEFIQYKGISHYNEEEAKNHTSLPCPGELLVEEHHSNYGEPWAGVEMCSNFLHSLLKLPLNHGFLRSVVGPFGWGYISFTT
ncbi:hypothetical protein L1987_05273 [Smallanthus sonchifolius]|uniref:Uncharacterized protein n=1 Tax=Smallanthus sonchifolius TaxID=185202 RepID=A0ACB9JUX5_9ASTR|nr:hypothetical protein L1987_05273 [Smallanthus sonchifolius]